MPMNGPLTHFHIAQRRHEIALERKASIERAREPHDKEAASLQELCGGIGHLWVAPSELVLDYRLCGICGAEEPKA